MEIDYEIDAFVLAYLKKAEPKQTLRAIGAILELQKPLNARTSFDILAKALEGYPPPPASYEEDDDVETLRDPEGGWEWTKLISHIVVVCYFGPKYLACPNHLS